ncbi:MAG: MmgE/PrpD family protein [Hyphomicrobiaceae bacterium]|nr:MmgE/PrpD family protein [Hyphomicrobiaceae bacterium]
MTTLATRIARFTAGLDPARLPPEVTEKAKVCLLNAYGMGLDCHDTPYAPVARAAALALDGEVAGGATMLADGRRTTIGGACLANSALFHGRAQEDSSGAAHFGTILIPLLTAMLELRRYALADLVPALVAGYEAGGLLEKAYASQTTPAGFRSTATYGAVAAAASAARLMRLDVGATAAALSNAVSFTGGLLQSFADGTDEWRYQPGLVARNGLAAAELARAGSVSAPDAFEGKSGFVRAFARTGCDVDRLAAGLGKDWLIHRVAFKPFPVCAFNQTPVTGALALREEIGAAGISSVRVRMNPYECGYAGMDATGPFSTISGTLMSIPFCIAATLIYGIPDMSRMTTYDDPAVNGLVGRIALVPDSNVPVLSAIIEVETTDGRGLVRDQRMTTEDYNYDRATISRLVRRIGVEQSVPPQAFDLLERFVDRLPAGSLDDVLRSFRLLEPRRAAS